MCKTNILHISDLHIGDTNICSGLVVQNIVSVLKSSYEKKIDTVIVTGDIFECIKKPNKKEEKERIKIAVMFFNYLYKKIKEINNEKLLREDFLFVPGNHDVCLKGKPWRLYEKFLEQFFKSSIPQYYYKSKNYLLVKQELEKKILYLGFNSNYYENGVNYEYISPEQISYVEEILSNGSYEDYYKIAFFHHPFYLFAENTGNHGGIIKNSKQLFRCLDKCDVKLILHGHKHWAREYTLMPRDMKKFNIIAASSISKMGIQQLSCNIIEKQENKLSLIRLMDENDGDFTTQNIQLKDNYKNFLLCEKLKKRKAYPQKDNYFNYVIEMINELYTDYSALNLLDKGINYLFLLFGIEYRLYHFLYKNENIMNFKDNFKNNYKKTYEEKYEDVFNDICNLLTNEFKLTKEQNIELEKNREKKIQYSYAFIAYFFADLYLSYIKCWNEECDQPLINENGLIRYDGYCGNVYIQLKSSNPKTYKYTVKKTAEFRRKFNDLKEFFSCARLNVRELILDMDYDGENAGTFQDLGAHIPSMLSLLTGKNIYSDDLVFTRELIQNAIDAISFRENIDEGYKKEKHEIEIDIEESRGKGGYFRIRDYGTGMRKEVIEQYFSILGKSYYKENNCLKNNDKYNPISNFGIGFLSVFKLCSRIIVETKHFDELNYYKLELKDKLDYFIIESPKNSNEFKPGTRITCYFKNGESKSCQQISNYIRENMLDIKYDIRLNNSDNIYARAIRSKKEYVMFIPFDQKRDKKPFEIKYFEEISNGNYKTYGHGMLIEFPSLDDKQKDKGKAAVLNAGVLIHDTNPADIFTKNKELIKPEYVNIYFNFPPNFLKIDMSREKAIGFNEDVCTIQNFQKALFECFQKQLKDYMLVNKKTPLAAISDAERYIRKICNIQDMNENIVELRIKILKDNIEFYIAKKDGSDKGTGVWKVISKFDSPKMEEDAKTIRQFFWEKLTPKDFDIIFSNPIKNREYETLEAFYSKLLFKDWKECQKRYLPIALAVCYATNNIEDDTNKKILSFINKTVLEECTLETLKESTSPFFSVKYNKAEVTAIVMKSEDITKVINKISEEKIADSNDAHIFIREHIIRELYNKYFTDNGKWENIQETLRSNYNKLKEETKLYAKNPDPKINGSQIASCYVGAMLGISDINLGTPKEINDPKCRWILHSAFRFLDMWEQSEGTNEQSVIINDDLERKILGTNVYEKYLKLLTIKEPYPEKFDVIYFAELLSWIMKYYKEHNEKNKEEGDCICTIRT